MNSKQTLAVVAFFSLMGSAIASDVVLPVAMDKADFEVTKAHLTQQLDSDRYSAISAQDKQTVMDALNRIDARLGKAAAQGQLDEQDRVDTFNDQEIINTITSHAAEASRMICDREAPTGSHRVEVLCMTLAAWMERERDGQEAMRRIDYNKTAQKID